MWVVPKTGGKVRYLNIISTASEYGTYLEKYSVIYTTTRLLSLFRSY
jgi:hypothetical protein